MISEGCFDCCRRSVDKRGCIFLHLSRNLCSLARPFGNLQFEAAAAMQSLPGQMINGQPIQASCTLAFNDDILRFSAFRVRV